MNHVSDRGVCFSEDINKIEEQKKSCGSVETSDTCHEILIPCGRPSSSEISTQSITKLYVNSVQGGAESINCNVNISLTQKNDDIAEINEVLEEDERIITYQRKKRLKKTELSDLPTTDLEFLAKESGSSSPAMHQRATSTSLDQPVEFESVPPCCSENMSEKMVTAEYGISGDAYCKDFPAYLGIKVLCSPVSNDATAINKNSRDADMLAINQLKELHDEAKETVSILEVHNVEFEEGNIGNAPRLSSGDALGGDTPLYHEEQSVASDADLSLKLLDGSKGAASQVIHESINVAVNRAFAGYTGKKLLVLDVNGLLVDISSYVPYDYDPDDIIMKKAVFKRPHCDDFLKFCFERFNVGVWSSRTKRNMEPILDFLLGNDKCKLLFCWDQSHCTYTGFNTVEKRHKPLLLKKLKKLWDKCEPDLPWERGVYNESNTLLLDDTPYKALSNPRYTAVFPYTYRFTDVRDNSLGPGGDLRIYLEGLAEAENVQEYVKQNPFGQRPITEKNLSWGFYRKVIEASSTPPRQTDEDDS